MSSYWSLVLVRACLVIVSAVAISSHTELGSHWHSLSVKYMSLGQIASFQSLERYLRAMPVWIAMIALFFLVALNAVSTLSMLPANTACGDFLGMLYGTVVFSLGSVAGSIISFLMGRYCLQQLAQSALRQSSILRALQHALNKQGIYMVFLIRLNPMTPFAATGIALGASSLTLIDHTIGTFIGILPGTALYCWLGESIGKVADDHNSPSAWISLTCNFAITVISSWFISVTVAKTMRRESFHQTLEQTDALHEHLTTSETDTT